MGGRSAHLFGRNVVLTTETHAFVIDPDDRRGAAGDAVRPSRTLDSLEPPGRQDRGAALDEKQTRLLDLRTRTPARPARVDRGGRRHRHRDHHLRATTSGEEASYLQLRDAQWRPVGTAQRVDGYVAEAVFLPGGREIAIARDEVVDIHDARTLAFSRTLEGHSGEVVGIELAGPARGLVWTAGEDGTAVAFDLTGRAASCGRWTSTWPPNVGSAAGDRAVITQRYDIDLNTARILDLEEGRDLFGELQPFTDCVCQIGHTAITPDGRLAVAGVFEWTDDYEEAITDRGRVVVWDTDTGELTRTIDTPWEPRGLAVTPDGTRAARQRLRRVGSLRPRVGRGDLEPRDRAAGRLDLRPAAVGRGARRVPARRPQGRPAILLDPVSGDELASLKLPGSGALTRVAFSADSRTMALGSDSGRLYFLDVATLEPVAPDRLVTAGIVIDLQMSPDGSMLAAMGSDGDVTLFDPARPGGRTASPWSTGSAGGSSRSPTTACGSTARPGPTTSCRRSRRVGGRRVSDRQHRAHARGVGRAPARRTGRADLRVTSPSPRPGRDRTATDRADPGVTSRRTSCELERESRP